MCLGIGQSTLGSSHSTTMTPLVIITRDRVSLTRLCVASFERYTDLDIHLVDHGSTYPLMVEYLRKSLYPVHRCGSKPPRALWEWEGLNKIVGNQPYLVTDPDVVLDPECPEDWLDVMFDVAVDNPHLAKVGLGIRIDDLPATPLAQSVRVWEQAFWQSQELTRHAAWRAPVDTTLALYPSLDAQPGFQLVPAVRLDAPYLIRHLPWYRDLNPDETEYYRSLLIPGSSHWTNGGW